MIAPDATLTASSPVDGAIVSRNEAGFQSDALVIVWSAFAPERVGEIAFLEPGPQAGMLGRGGDSATRPPAPDVPPTTSRVSFLRQRPGIDDPQGQLQEPGVSRDQLLFVTRDGGLSVERLGRCALLVNGEPRDKAALLPGDTLMLRGQVLLLYVRRPRYLPALRFYPKVTWPFGAPDPSGLVGESPAVWQLRDDAAFFAQGDRHALITGESGTGKELVARTVHALSQRAGKPFLSRNAATLPSGLIDAELFGNVKNYPNPGTPERPGIIGQADGTTLFLDEIGEMPLESQAHLLRVLDAGGEYQRLGDPLSRRSRFCLVAATNRSPELLKHDVLSRFAYRTTTPTLQARREDIPLLVCHLLRGIAARHPHVASFFGPAAGGAKSAREREIGQPSAPAWPRVALELIDALVRWPYTLHLRELEEHLVRAVMKSRGDMLEYEPPRAIRSAASTSVEPKAIAAAAPDEAPVGEHDSSPELERPPVPLVTKEEVLSALERTGWIIRRAYRELGLQSRYQLYRLMDKHGIERASGPGKED